jgi:hypothetical protein
MTRRVLRLVALGVLALPVAGCVSYHEHTRPEPSSSVVVTPPAAPAPSTVVVQPAQ